MMIFKALATMMAIGAATAQRPANVSMCDFYAQKIFGNNNATTQQGVMTLIANTAIIGNYTTPNVGVSVTGIAPISVFNGTTVNLLLYFIPALNSTNDGVTTHGVPKLFLDDGGAVPLGKSLPSNGDVNSAQYRLVTHVWQYFGVLLGCSLQGTPGFPAYGGRTSMWEVHKFMDSTIYEQGWFVNQLTLAAASIGFSPADTTLWFNIMTGLFSYRCAPPVAVGTQAPQLQSICVHSSCPLAPNANCALYETVTAPAIFNASLVTNYTKVDNATSTAASSTSTPKPTATTSDASSLLANVLAVLGAVALAFAY